MATNIRGRPLKPQKSNISGFSPTPAMMALWELKDKGRTWEEIAQLLSKKDETINHVLVWRVARGDIKNSKKINMALGLETMTVEVEVCENCGKIHKQIKSCPRKSNPPKRYRRHIEFESVERMNLFDQMIAENEHETATSFVNCILDEWEKSFVLPE